MPSPLERNNRLQLPAPLTLEWQDNYDDKDNYIGYRCYATCMECNIQGYSQYSYAGWPDNPKREEVDAVEHLQELGCYHASLETLQVIHELLDLEEPE